MFKINMVRTVDVFYFIVQSKSLNCSKGMTLWLRGDPEKLKEDDRE